MKVRLLAGVLGVALALWLLPRTEPAQAQEKYHVAMGTVVRIALYVDETQAEPLFALAQATIDSLAGELTHYGTQGQLARLNDSDSGEVVEVSADLATVLARSLDLCRQTGGAFDPTLGGLTALWGFPEAMQPPQAAWIDSVLRTTGIDQVDLQGRRLRRSTTVRLDLGAAAKGFIVDRAVRALQSAGAPAGVVEAGGDLRFWGRKPDGRDWRFGVQHPREPGQIVAVDDVGLPALATSGDYEQTFEHDGQRYHHLLDPATGWPARRAVSATVWARSAMDADALATAAFVAGPEQALRWAAADDSLEVMLYYESGDSLHRVLSDGLKGRVNGS